MGYTGLSSSIPNTGNICASSVNCKHCNGLGWIDPDEQITVPRKYVKESYYQ